MLAPHSYHETAIWSVVFAGEEEGLLRAAPLRRRVKRAGSDPHGPKHQYLTYRLTARGSNTYDVPRILGGFHLPPRDCGFRARLRRFLLLLRRRIALFCSGSAVLFAWLESILRELENCGLYLFWIRRSYLIRQCSMAQCTRKITRKPVPSTEKTLPEYANKGSWFNKKTL